MNERRAHILDLVTENYISSAHPVPSAVIAQQLQVSSATVRNDFSMLEERGYLKQPHPSAGRVPTRLSYDRYARKFIPPFPLPPGQQEFLASRLKGVHGDNLLQQIANVTAELSGYAVVVSLPASDELYAHEIHLSALSDSRVLAVIVLENGLVRQLMLELNPAPSNATLNEVEHSLRQLTLPITKVPVALKDIAKRVEAELARTFLALAKAWPAMNPARLFSQGLSNVLAEPESADPNFVRRVVEHVEQPGAQKHPTNKDEDNLMIFLEETLALVSARLNLGSSQAELLLLGPMRMRYPQTLMIAHGVTELVARRT